MQITHLCISEPTFNYLYLSRYVAIGVREKKKQGFSKRGGGPHDSKVFGIFPQLHPDRQITLHGNRWSHGKRGRAGPSGRGRHGAANCVKRLTFLKPLKSTWPAFLLSQPPAVSYLPSPCIPLSVPLSSPPTLLPLTPSIYLCPAPFPLPPSFHFFHSCLKSNLCNVSSLLFSLPLHNRPCTHCTLCQTQQ